MVYPGEGAAPPVGRIAFEEKPSVVTGGHEVDNSSWAKIPQRVPVTTMLYEREFLLQSCHFNEQKTYSDYETALQQRAAAVGMKARSPGMTTMASIQHLESAFDTLKRVLADVHGHNFRVRVTASQSFMEGQEKPTALVWDEELAKVVLEWDRTNLSVHPDMKGRRATTEVLCEVLRDKLKQKFPGPHWVVEIWETPEIRAMAA